MRAREYFVLVGLALIASLGGSCSSEGSPCYCADKVPDGGVPPVEVPPCECDCNIELPVCLGVTCSGHGTCVDNDGAAACECDPGYTPQGLSCMGGGANSCAGVTCSGHGTCQDNGGIAICQCVTGYTAQGLSCVPDGGDVCAGVTCSGHGTCQDNAGVAMCLCDVGFHPQNLDCLPDGGDVCAGVTCSGHGTCQDNAGVASCLCDAGFHPQNLDCLPDGGDACAGVTCSDHGTCQDNGGVASCLCEAGFHPQSLECLPDGGGPCDGVACSGHGTCQDNGGAAECVCDADFHAEGLECVADPVDPCAGVDCSGHGSCVDNGGVAECDCESGYHAEGLSCLEDPRALLCQEECLVNEDCWISAATAGYQCGADSRCIQCTEDSHCRAHLSGWWYGAVCTDGGNECGMMGSCIDIGDGVARCASKPTAFLTCEQLMMDEVEMPAIDGSGNVTVCGNTSGTCADGGYCTTAAAAGCATNGECVALYMGWATPCAALGECAMGECINVGDGVGRCAMEPGGMLTCEMMTMEELTLPAIDGSGDLTVCGFGSALDSICQDDVCLNPCGGDGECAAIAGHPICDLDSGKCVCTLDEHCEGQPNVSVCVEGTCGCQNNLECTTTPTFDNTTWVCQ